MRHGGHRGEGTYNEYYAPRNPATDGQGSYFDDTLRTIVNDRFRAMTLCQNPELWQSLPAEKQHALENSPAFIAIEEQLERLSDPRHDSTTLDRRRELYVQKRKLVSEELRRLKREQPKKLSKVTLSEQIGHQRTMFPRIRTLIMPARHRLAVGLFVIASLRSEEGRAVLRDMITLCQQKAEVEFRPGLESAKHVHSCYRKRLKAEHSFAEFCFLCSQWSTDAKEWTRHYSSHSEKASMLRLNAIHLTTADALRLLGSVPDAWATSVWTLPHGCGSSSIGQNGRRYRETRVEAHRHNSGPSHIS
jgi:hypothetical protein